MIFEKVCRMIADQFGVDVNTLTTDRELAITIIKLQYFLRGSVYKNTN